ncbi:MAG: pimeloyl-ACP methyl esterase BioG family protein, partial [Succinivibrio sp.]
MRTCFARQGGKNLVIFFEGYGQDEKPFARMAELMPEDSSLLCCFDYAAKGDLPDVGAYSKVRIIAWSMGVALAPHYARGLGNIVERIAVNGTLEGIDPKHG